MIHAVRRAAAVVLAVVAMAALGVPALTHAQGKWVAPAADKDKKNPLPADASTIAQGKKVAEVNCVSCHGARGKGDGAAAVALNPKPADWTSPAVQSESDGEIFWKISTGRGAMPSWNFLSDNDRWAVIRYIRTLKK